MNNPKVCKVIRKNSNRTFVSVSWLRQLFLFSIIFISSTVIKAQNTLTLDEAIAIAIKNNYSITLAKNESEALSNNSKYSAFALLPQVTFNAIDIRSKNNTKQDYTSGLVVNRDGVKSSNTNMGVAFNWTIFDGFKMFATYKKLQELQDMGELNARIQIENTILQVMEAYFNVVRSQQLKNTMQELVTLDEERVKISETKLEIGSGSKVDVLQAKIDRNTHRSTYLKQQTLITSAQASLNQLLNQNQDYAVTDSVPFNTQITLKEIEDLLYKQNNELFLQERAVTVAKYSLQESQSLRYPRIGLNANYNFSKTENQAGFVLLNQNLGFNYGFSVSWNLFNGFNVTREIKNAEIGLLNAKLGHQNQKNILTNDLKKNWEQYITSIEILKLQEQSFTMARENLAIAMERFKIGSSSTLEIKEIQRSYEEVVGNLVSARYDAKIAEARLLKLSGGLIK